jgi:hypothetical protein
MGNSNNSVCQHRLVLGGGEIKPPLIHGGDHIVMGLEDQSLISASRA